MNVAVYCLISSLKFKLVHLDREREIVSVMLLLLISDELFHVMSQVKHEVLLMGTKYVCFILSLDVYIF